MTFFGFWRRKAAIPRRNPGTRPVDVERKREKAERVRRESFHGPPLTEWERMAMYGVVEAERNRQG